MLNDLRFSHLFQSGTFRSVLVIVGILVVLLAVFALGAFVGFQKARFTYGWGMNYPSNFAGPSNGFATLRNIQGDHYINGHGTFGTIIKLDPSAIVVKGQGDVEKLINVDDDTTIKRATETLGLPDLKLDEQVVIIGAPKSDGSIDAKLIRVFEPGTPFFPFLKVSYPLLRNQSP